MPITRTLHYCWEQRRSINLLLSVRKNLVMSELCSLAWSDLYKYSIHLLVRAVHMKMAAKINQQNATENWGRERHHS